jgi:hypothetical protein
MTLNFSIRFLYFLSQNIQILILLRNHMAVKWTEETRQQIPFLGSESARTQWLKAGCF